VTPSERRLMVGSTVSPRQHVSERSGDKRENFALFNVTCLASIYFQYLEARKRSSSRCGRAEDIDLYIIHVGEDQII
jgi:hypothetical protein